MRLILPSVLLVLAVAGCGSDTSRDQGALADTRTPAEPVRLLAPGSMHGADQSLVDGPPLVAASEDPSVRRCDPNYDPCVPIDSDVDCLGGRGNGPSYVAGPVRVTGNDVYGLDGRDDDGVGCEMRGR